MHAFAERLLNLWLASDADAALAMSLSGTTRSSLPIEIRSADRGKPEALDANF